MHIISVFKRKFHNAKIENKDSVEVWGSGLAKREFLHHIHLINDLEEIGFKFEESLLEYINKYYPEKVFVMLPYYHPDGYNFI